MFPAPAALAKGTACRGNPPVSVTVQRAAVQQRTGDPVTVSWSAQPVADPACRANCLGLEFSGDPTVHQILSICEETWGAKHVVANAYLEAQNKDRNLLTGPVLLNAVPLMNPVEHAALGAGWNA